MVPSAHRRSSARTVFQTDSFADHCRSRRLAQTRRSLIASREPAICDVAVPLQIVAVWRQRAATTGIGARFGRGGSASQTKNPSARRSHGPCRGVGNDWQSMPRGTAFSGHRERYSLFRSKSNSPPLLLPGFTVTFKPEVVALLYFCGTRCFTSAALGAALPEIVPCS